MNVGIIGGGISGLALAVRLARRGNTVTVIEKGAQPGGLATYQDHGEFIFDRYYHVILPTDRNLISFIGDIGLGDELVWKNTLTGFYVDETHYSVSNAMEFLKFPPLSLWAKFRLAWTILYCSRINDWKRLEQVELEDFLLRLSGRETYEKLWKPLLLAKLGENYKRVSAVFIWTYIKRMFSARDKSASKEHMGHVRGGYRTIISRAIEVIEEHGGSVQLGRTVADVSPSATGSMRVTTDTGSLEFDKVVFTGPVTALAKVTDESLVKIEDSGQRVEYLGVQCMSLVTRQPVTPFYVLNIADKRIPFTGAVGMSNILEPGETAGLHLTYLPKYIHSGHEDFNRPAEEIEAEFREGVALLFPDLGEADIVSSTIYSARIVQPLQVRGFSEHIPKTTTRHENFYVLNTAQFVNNTLNNNEVIRAVNAFMDEHGDGFAAASERKAA